MDRITAGAGVSKATVYSYFRSKEELLAAVVEAVVTPVKQVYLEGLDPTLDLHSWLIALGKLVAGHVLLPDVTALERLIIAEALRFPELGKAFEVIAIHGSLELLRPRLEKAIASGELRNCDADKLLDGFVELCAGSIHRHMLLNEGPLPSQSDIDRHVEWTVEVFLHGCASPAYKRAIRL